MQFLHKSNHILLVHLLRNLLRNLIKFKLDSDTYSSVHVEGMTPNLSLLLANFLVNDVVLAAPILNPLSSLRTNLVNSDDSFDWLLAQMNSDSEKSEPSRAYNIVGLSDDFLKDMNLDDQQDDDDDADKFQKFVPLEEPVEIFYNPSEVEEVNSLFKKIISDIKIKPSQQRLSEIDKLINAFLQDPSDPDTWQEISQKNFIKRINDLIAENCDLDNHNSLLGEVFVPVIEDEYFKIV